MAALNVVATASLPASSAMGAAACTNLTEADTVVLATSCTTGFDTTDSVACPTAHAAFTAGFGAASASERLSSALRRRSSSALPSKSGSSLLRAGGSGFDEASALAASAPLSARLCWRTKADECRTGTPFGAGANGAGEASSTSSGSKSGLRETSSSPRACTRVRAPREGRTRALSACE
eukprot:CAMPEP_0170143722 /NCGR_PEP_ID=MMETSP0033_2-20121228/12693_1 /TAXON_ID=195969 /ORGANISM="Dolichomastix tenuilepis, Strain CCMP3274" /LENGTH=178 /DNA_ID=CAMNT_0010380189 /DNA_START=176 /DNA_END=709 /DNA_ORIENTATION=-